MDKDVQHDKIARFQQLHQGPGILVLPNAWDVMSGLLLEHAGFDAIATTSAGIGYVYGYPVGEFMPRDEMLDAVGRIARRVTLPLTVDMEAGYGRAPEAVAETVRLTIRTGAAGINIEDSTYDPAEPLLAPTLATERIAAAREAATQAGMPIVINARTDVFWNGAKGAAALDEAIARANAFRAAGADCLFVPGVRDIETIRRLTDAIDGPLNLLAGAGVPPVETLREIGVRRLTVGAIFARVGYAALVSAAAELKNRGSYDFAAGIPSHAELNGLMKR